MSRYTDDAVFLCRRAPNAQAIRYLGQQTTGPVSEDDRITLDASGAERLDRVTVALVPTDALSGLARHQRVTVGQGRDAVAYTLRDFRKIEDGLLTELHLARVVA